MKIGFQLKGSTKRKVIVPVDNKLTDLPKYTDEVKREAIQCIEGNEVRGAEAESGPLVIPLPAPLNAGLSLDEIAARELLADIENPGGGVKDSGLVIEATGSNVINGKKQPLLLANVAPELLKIEDDVERYKKDVSMRPDDIDAKSDAYTAVPIEEFGAALLRGMGWAGPTAESEEKDKKGFELVVRESRLGLGATAKPPDEKGKKGKNPKSDKTKEEWKRKAEDALRKQQLQVGDLVWLRDPLYASQHARVEAVRGVPGLDRIRVVLVDIKGANGEPKVVDVKRTDAVLTSGEEGRGSPTVEPAESRGRHRDEGRRSDSHRDRDRDRDRHDEDRRGGRHQNGDEKTNRKRRRDEYDDQSRAERRMDRDGTDADAKTKSVANENEWLQAGIKVRVISEKVKSISGGEDCYLKKFDVMSVSGRGLATLRQIGESFVAEGVKEKYLENVLPALGEKCVVLSGKYKGKCGILKEKNKQKEELLIELDDPPSRVTVSLEGAAAVCDHV